MNATPPRQGRSGKKEAARSLPPASPESIAKQRRSNARLERHLGGWDQLLLSLEEWSR